MSFFTSSSSSSSSLSSRPSFFGLTSKLQEIRENEITSQNIPEKERKEMKEEEEENNLNTSSDHSSSYFSFVNFTSPFFQNNKEIIKKNEEIKEDITSHKIKNKPLFQSSSSSERNHPNNNNSNNSNNDNNNSNQMNEQEVIF